MSARTVDTLSEFFTEILTLKSGEKSYVFRGQSVARWPVTCGAHRRIVSGRKAVNAEKEFTPHFLRSYLAEKITEAKKRMPHESLAAATDLDILADMQHFGAATNLIDFSKNALIALYFAIHTNYTEPGRVVCVNLLMNANAVLVPGRSLDQVLSNTADQLYYFYPNHSTPRIPKQDGLFIFHHSGCIEEHFCDKSIVIPANAKRAMLDDLMMLTGINDETLYPDYYGYMQANGCQIPYKVPSPREFSKRILEYIDEYKYEKALDVCKRLLDTDPDSYVANLNLAKCYRNIRQRDCELALKHCAKAEAVREKDGDVSLLNEFALAYISLGEYEKAELKFEEAMKFVEKGDASKTRALRGNMAWLQLCWGHQAKAGLQLQTLADEKKTLHVLINLGHLSLVNGDTSKALEQYAEAMKHAPDEAAFLTILEADCEDLKRSNKALHDDHVRMLMTQIKDLWPSVVVSPSGL